MKLWGGFGLFDFLKLGYSDYFIIIWFWNWGIVITLLFNAEYCGAVIGLFI